mgnify:CR=1 FL=1
MKNSVKGMTWGSPEFVSVAKNAEQKANHQRFEELTKELLEMIDKRKVSDEVLNQFILILEHKLFDQDELIKIAK